MDSFGDHFSSLLGNGAIWTIISNSNHKCRLCNTNFRLSIACNVGLSYNSKCGYVGTKWYICFSNIIKDEKLVVVVRLQQLVPDFPI